MVNKSTYTDYSKKGQDYSYYSEKHKKTIIGKIIKEKKGYIWVCFNNTDVRKIKKY